MTKLVLTFLVGVLAGSIGVQLQEQRAADKERKVLAADESRAAPSVEATNGATSSRDSPDAAPSPSITHAQPSPRPAQNVPREEPNAGPHEPAVPVMDAHEPLLSTVYDGRPLREWHEKLEGEEKDMTWSYEREQQLTEFFTPPRGIAFDVRSIECRKTMCEIQAFALGPMQDNTVAQDMEREPWYDFTRSFIDLDEHDGSTSVLIYLMRQT